MPKYNPRRHFTSPAETCRREIICCMREISWLAFFRLICPCVSNALRRAWTEVTGRRTLKPLLSIQVPQSRRKTLRRSIWISVAAVFALLFIVLAVYWGGKHTPAALAAQVPQAAVSQSTGVAANSPATLTYTVSRGDTIPGRAGRYGYPRPAAVQRRTRA